MYYLICDQEKLRGIEKFNNFTAQSESESEFESDGKLSGLILIRIRNQKTG